MEIHVLRRLDFAGVNFQNGLASGKIGQLHRHAAVKAAGARERRVERFGTVRCSKDDDAVVSFKAVHFRKKLVERLLPLVVAAHGAAAALLTDGVDFVDKHDAGRLLLCLAEEIAHLARAHADKHLHKLRAGDGEERHVGLARHGFGEHRLTRSRRADKQNAFRHRCAGVRILARIMEIVHDLGKALFCLILAGDIAKADALRGLDVDLGVALSHTEGHDVLAAHLIHQLFSHELAEEEKDDQRQNERQEIAQDRRHGLLDVLCELRAAVIEALREHRVVHHAGHIDRAVVFVGEYDLRIANVYLADLPFIDHAHEGAVVRLHNALPVQQRRDKDVEEQQRNERDRVIIRQRLFGIFDFLH